MPIHAAFALPHPPLIVPAVGRGEEFEIQKTSEAYAECAKKIAALKPETIIVTSPHALCYADYFHISPGEKAEGSFARFHAPQERISAAYDEEFAARISEFAAKAGIRAGTAGERFGCAELDHGTMVPLYFVNNFYSDYKLVRIGLSGLSFQAHWDFGRTICEAASSLNRNCVLIASGDLSHKLKADGPYGFDAAGPAYDERIMRDMGKGNLRALLDYDEDFTEQAAQCGHRSFLIMGGAIEGAGLQARTLSYEGPFGVGYGICEFV